MVANIRKKIFSMALYVRIDPVSNFLDGIFMFCKDIHHYQAQGWCLGCGSWKQIWGRHPFFQVFQRFGHALTDPKNKYSSSMNVKNDWFAAKQVFLQSSLKQIFLKSFSKSLAFLTSGRLSW